MIRRAGIIAAGHGERLSARTNAPKPLVPVAGRPLAYWTVASLREAGVESITMLLNSRGEPVRRFLEEAFPSMAWSFISQDTASSWESFRLVSRRMAADSDLFLISTVDALLAPEDPSRFSAAVPPGAEGAVALTEFVDDEKPLWASVGEDGWIRALGPDARGSGLVTAGLYALSAAAALTTEGLEFARLRDYWAYLARRGRLAGIRVGKAVDVDRPEDIEVAERFLLERRP